MGEQRLEVPVHVKVGLVQYLTRVAQLTPDEIMEVADVSADDIVTAMGKPSILEPPLEDDEMIRCAKDVLGRLGLI